MYIDRWVPLIRDNEPAKYRVVAVAAAVMLSTSVLFSGEEWKENRGDDS